jgi:hypothetical protein
LTLYPHPNASACSVPIDEAHREHACCFFDCLLSVLWWRDLSPIRLPFLPPDALPDAVLLFLVSLRAAMRLPCNDLAN